MGHINTALLAGTIGLTSAACSPVEQGRGAAFDPSASTGAPGSGDTGGTHQGSGSPASDDEAGDSGVECEPGEQMECLCDDGLSLGTQHCDEGLWGPCECTGDGEGSDDAAGDSTGGGDTTTGGESADEVCYAGADGSYSTCFPLHYFDPGDFPVGYDYPDALGDDPNYRKPVAFIDLTEADPTAMLAANFRLDELAQEHKGRYAIVQPHAVESLQDIRDAVGGIGVNSGYRSPEYNTGVGGATHSRHMYGDGFDLDPASVPLSTLEATCESHGGMLVEYTSHVHCDFRFDDVATEFFGSPSASIERQPHPWNAELRRAGALFWAPATGFDEGEPTRRWTARDAEGRVLLEARGPAFAPPRGTARVSVRVGAQVDLVSTLD